MSIEKSGFNPTYEKENGIFVVNIEDIPLPGEFTPRYHAVIHIPPGKIGGNHMHPRTEVFICIDEGAELHWIDPETREKQVEAMSPTNGQPKIFTVNSMVPHAVVNTCDRSITLIELADGPRHSVEQVSVV